MQAIKRTLSPILVLIYLSGCTQLSGLRNVSVHATAATTSAQTVASLETDSPDITKTLVRTPIGGPGTNSSTPQPTGAAIVPSLSITPGECQLEPVTQPSQPVKTLLPNELDQEAGLHMTGRPQWIDLETYRLKVTGLVDHSLSLTYDDLRCMPKVTNDPELICPEVFVDRATWTGVPIIYILELAGVQQGATEITLVSADGYEVRVPVDTASADKNFLAYEVNEKPLPVLHGFPLRAVFPSMWGSYWLKWLVEIRIS